MYVDSSSHLSNGALFYSCRLANEQSIGLPPLLDN
jgi:hypothetical protein